MAFYGGGKLKPPPIPISLHHSNTQPSNIRPSCNNLVFLPPTPHHNKQQPLLHRHNPNPRSIGPTPLHTHKPPLFPLFPSYPRRLLSKSEIGINVWNGDNEELDVVALGAACEF